MPVATAVTTRTQAQRRAATRAALLKSAGSVFAKRGFHGATLDEIARRARLSKGAVYHHFESKEDLFLTLLEDTLADRLRDIARAFDAGDASQRFMSGVERNPAWPPLFFEFVAFSGRDSALRARFRRRFLLRIRETLTPLLQERFGVRDPQRAEEIAIAVAAFANGMILERLFDPAGVPDEIVARAMAAMVEGMIRAG